MTTTTTGIVSCVYRATCIRVAVVRLYAVWSGLAWLCRKAKKTKIVSYIQTDLGGMLPKTLVENALPSNQIDFFASLRKALQDAGFWENE